MATVLLTGATGVLGQELLSRLRATDHTVRATSRSPPAQAPEDWVELDLVTGTGLPSALKDVDIVVHAASDARGDSEAVDVGGTKRLLEAAGEEDIENFLYVSIVGIEEIPYSYYQHKLAAENAIQESAVPETIIRSTQFHPFVAAILNWMAKIPVWFLPTNFRLQPIDVGEAAEAIVEHTTLEPAGRVPDIGGPAVHSVRELAEMYRAERGLRRPIVRLPIPGKTAAAFRDGKATCPDRSVGSTTWSEWLAAQDGIPGKEVY